MKSRSALAEPEVIPHLRIVEDAPADPTIPPPIRRALRIEHDESTGKTVVFVPTGDLSFRADHGAIELEARDGVRIKAPGATHVAVEPGAVRVVAPAIEATAARAEGRFAEAQVVTRALAVTADRLVQTVSLLETRAHRIVERAKESYREVEGLSQTRAGRLRHVARTTVLLVADRAILRAAKDFKILGDKIHLA